jgi:probable rRNA maturation factor
MRLNTFFKDEQDKFELRVALKAIARKAIFNTLVYEGFDKDCEVSVTFTDNEQIKELNKNYRNKNSATDVLSFPMFDDFTNIEMVNDIPLGDIVISLERAAKQGYEIGHSIYHEVAFLCVHSTLHLLGYDHETSKADEKEMFGKQKEIMEIMGF